MKVDKLPSTRIIAGRPSRMAQWPGIYQVRVPQGRSIIIAITLMTRNNLHPWVRPIKIAQVRGSRTPALDSAASALLDWLRDAGCTVTSQPDNATDLIFTTRCFGDV